MSEDIEAKLEAQLRTLHRIGSRIVHKWNKFSQAQIETLSESPLFGPWYKECLLATGSKEEGGLYARMFRHGELITELDYMFCLGSIVDPTTQLKTIERVPGYFLVKFDGILECFRNGVCEKFLESCHVEEINSNGFLTRSSVLDMTRSMFSSTPTKTRAYEFMADTMLQPDIPCKGTVSFKQKGPSAAVTVLLTTGQKHLAEVRVDTVPCFELSYWPDNWGFQEFNNRARRWPSDPKEVEKVQYMVHIVPKTSPKLKYEGESNTCWRLSFSKAEMHFKSLFTDDESRTYLLFKILFYANIKKVRLGERTLASYLCKTTMLWMMEEEGEELCNRGLSLAIQKLFRKLKQFLDSDNGMPNFFCPSMNLLEGYSEDLITESSNVAGDISERPFEYFPSNFEKDCDLLERLLARLDETHFEDFVDALVDYMKRRNYLRGRTAFELFWHSMQPRNWRVRLFFHPFVRAVTRAWARQRCFAIRNRLERCACFWPFHRDTFHSETLE